MDSFIKMGTQAYQAYEASQQGHQGQGGGEIGIQGSAALNSADNNRVPDAEGVNQLQNQAVEHAAAQSGGNSDMFAQAMSFAQQHVLQQGNHEVDESKVQDAHAQAYGQGNASQLGASSMGAAAAMQAFKSFTSGSSGSDTSGGSFQSKLIGQAMSEAAKLFDQSGGAASGSKQDAVNSAGQTVMKLLLKNQVSGMLGGGNSGGLASLASQFLK
ncbi:hypothetical protein T439DRAFT_323811 [Meredithblackwellia eburnea MCA 4105]